MKRKAPSVPVLAPGEVPPVLALNIAEVWGHPRRWTAAAKAWRRTHGVGYSVVPDRGHWSIGNLDDHGQEALADARLASHGVTREDLPALVAQADAVAVPWADGVGNVQPAHERAPGTPRPV